MAWLARRPTATDHKTVLQVLGEPRPFGVESYGVVGWACAPVRAKQAADKKGFKKRVEQVVALIRQQKI